MFDDIVDYSKDHTQDGGRKPQLNLFAGMNEHQRKSMARWFAQSIPNGSFWFHRSGKPYQVFGHTNFASDNWEDYPPTILYRDHDGNEWSRPAHDWHRSMTRNDARDWAKRKK
jgi:hypothetical protein